MAKSIVPSLSAEDGWVSTPARMVDYLMVHFLESDYSQTYLFFGEVSSLAKIVQETQGDMVGFVTRCQNQLMTYFSRYFENVIVEVTDVTVGDLSARTFSLYISYTDHDGVTQVVEENIRNQNSTWTRVVKAIQ